MTAITHPSSISISTSPQHLDELELDETDDDDEPVLRWKDGRLVDTWREGYPYTERMPRPEYEVEKRLLQIELLKLQNWVKDTGQRIVILFEGRDAAGKGGTIKRFLEHLNPRGAQVVALEKPSERERGEWYFQRYVAHLPSVGEMVLFDRSWYNRAGVERVMGFCSDAEYHTFIEQAPAFEHLLVGDSIGVGQAVVLGFAGGATHPLSYSAHRPRSPVETVADGSGLARSLGRLHRGQGGHVRADRHRIRPVDGGEEQRQEAGPDQRHALRARAVRLSAPGRQRRRPPTRSWSGRPPTSTSTARPRMRPSPGRRPPARPGSSPPSPGAPQSGQPASRRTTGSVVADLRRQGHE